MGVGEAVRKQQLADGLAAVRARIAAACTAAGRSADEVTLVVVTKFFPASDVRLLAELGVRDVGENRHQEAEAKAAELRAEAGAGTDLRWHFIGGLQSNKAAAVARYADVVHSLDRPKLVAPLARGAEQRPERGDGPLDVLVQVSLDHAEAAGRSGAAPDDVPALVERIGQHEALRLRGVMGVAPLGGEPDRAFAELAEVAATVRDLAPDADWISAGMSGDLEQALRNGATHVRVGSAVLGKRPEIK